MGSCWDSSSVHHTAYQHPCTPAPGTPPLHRRGCTAASPAVEAGRSSPHPGCRRCRGCLLLLCRHRPAPGPLRVSTFPAAGLPWRLARCMMSPTRRRRVLADGPAVRVLHGSQAWALRPSYALCCVSLGFTGCPGSSSWRGRASTPDAAAVAGKQPGSASREAACQLLRPDAFGPSPTHVAALHPLASLLLSPSVTSAWQSCHFQTSLLPFLCTSMSPSPVS